MKWSIKVFKWRGWLGSQLSETVDKPVELAHRTWHVASMAAGRVAVLLTFTELVELNNRQRELACHWRYRVPMQSVEF